MGNANRPAITAPAREGMSAVRCSFVHLGQPYANKPGDTPKYQITCMFSKQDATDMAAITQLAQDLEAVRVEQWPNPQTRPMTPVVAQQPGQGPKSPIKDGDVAVDSNGRLIMEKNPEYAGHFIVACSNTNPVSVIGPNMEMLDGNMCRSGYWYKVSLNAYAYTNNGGGATLGLNGAQMMREDVVLGGGGPTTDQMFMATGGQDPNMYQQPGQPPPVQSAPAAPVQGVAAPVQPGAAPLIPATQQAPVYGAPAPAQTTVPAATYPVTAPGQPVYQAPLIQQPGQPAPVQPLQQPGSIV